MSFPESFFNLQQENVTVRCPYMPEHVMHKQSLLTHLIRCPAQNKNDFKVCQYNQMHIVPKDEINRHYQDCYDYQIYLKKQKQNGYQEDEDQWGPIHNSQIAQMHQIQEKQDQFAEKYIGKRHQLDVYVRWKQQMRKRRIFPYVPEAQSLDKYKRKKVPNNITKNSKQNKKSQKAQSNKSNQKAQYSLSLDSSDNLSFQTPKTDKIQYNLAKIHINTTLRSQIQSNTSYIHPNKIDASQFHSMIAKEQDFNLKKIDEIYGRKSESYIFGKDINIEKDYTFWDGKFVRNPNKIDPIGNFCDFSDHPNKTFYDLSIINGQQYSISREQSAFMKNKTNKDEPKDFLGDQLLIEIHQLRKNNKNRKESKIKEKNIIDS